MRRRTVFTAWIGAGLGGLLVLGAPSGEAAPAAAAPAAAAPAAAAPAETHSPAARPRTSGAVTPYLTWNVQALPQATGQFLGITCASSSDCFAAGSSASNAQGTIFATTDGGARWSPQAPPSTSSALESVSCVSVSACWAVGYDKTTVNGQPGYRGVIIATSNGGTTWTAEAAPANASLLFGIACTSAADCWAVGDSYDPTTEVTTGVIVDTTTSGAAWRQETTPQATGDLYGLTCAATSCLAVGDDTSYTTGVMLSTSDGQRWARVSIPHTSTLAAVTCAGKTDCWAVGSDAAGSDGVVLASTTGGASWTIQQSPATNATLGGVSCSSPSTCQVVGARFDPDTGAFTGALALVTSDGGATWETEQVPPAANALVAVSCLTAADCWAAGYRQTPGSDTGAIFSGTPSPPLVSGVSPSSGPAAGGTDVEIGGAAFTGATTVAFGGAPATNVTVVSDAEITATAPPGPGAGGYVPVTVATAIGTSATTASAGYVYELPESFHPLAPFRIADTRARSGEPGAGQSLHAGGTLDVQVTGTGKGSDAVPLNGVTAAVLNVTAVGASAPTYLTVYPAGVARPLASNLNVATSLAVANLTTVPVGANGRVTIFNAGGVVDVVVDVEGYFAASEPGAGLYHPLAPVRICDTRTTQPSNPCTGSRPTPTRPLGVPVADRGGVPASGAGAVVVNLTAVDPSTSGYLTAFPAGGTTPTTSNVNDAARAVAANRVVVPLGANGAIEIFSSGGSPDVVVDVVGWYTDGSDPKATGSLFTPLAPVRVCDTRAGQPANQCTGKAPGPGATLAVSLAGLSGIPPDAVAVVANATVTQATTAGYLTVYPPGEARPVASDLNWAPGRTVPNLVVAALGPGGSVNVFNSAGTTQVVIDAEGWYS